ncbi:MAG: VIT1/CCC1 transporter family protein [Chlamydiia bacterium]|nr:VIT1/CCC1 transporter family protein [Chlamydiia bacterium]
MSFSHFADKNALSHVTQKRMEGFSSHAESHGTEIPGHLSAGADAARETGVLFLFLYLLLSFLALPSDFMLKIFFAFSCAWIVWKTGRSAILGWARLERLHRIIHQELYEIKHHREQEKEELRALYQQKGFEGKLLDDVVNVLMADEDRLLRVMLEEELGLTLSVHQHPLKQALGAFLGTFFTSALCFFALWFSLPYGIFFTAPLTIAIGAFTLSRYEKNQVVSALIWTLALATLSIGTLIFSFNLLLLP